MQAIGAEGIVAAQCKQLVNQYVPEIARLIAVLPPSEVIP